MSIFNNNTGFFQNGKSFGGQGLGAGLQNAFSKFGERLSALKPQSAPEPDNPDEVGVFDKFGNKIEYNPNREIDLGQSANLSNNNLPQSLSGTLKKPNRQFNVMGGGY